VSADLRVAELLVGLSLVTDLGMGNAPGDAARSSFVATAIARELDLPDETVGDTYYTALLQHVGCTGYAHEAAALLGGDEIAVKAPSLRIDPDGLGDYLFAFLPRLAPSAPLPTRLRAAGAALAYGGRIKEGYSRTNCEVAAQIARRAGLSDGVARGLTDIYEQWNGKGGPGKLAGEDISPAARIAQVGAVAALFDRLGGRELALRVVGGRAGRSLDPAAADVFLRRGAEVLDLLETADVREALVAAEPEPALRVSERRLDEVCRAFGDVVDLKCPFHHGHAAGVGRLAAEAAASLGLSVDDVAAVRRAGLLHDLGRAAVPNGIWTKPGPLTTSDWEAVRLHAYQTERILVRSGPLAPLAPLAGMHHERLDGSGYHRQATAASIPMPGRVLAAADAYQAMTQERPHRRALRPDAAAAALREETAAGRLDGDATSAVLLAAGHTERPLRRAWPAGLSDRQVEVLRLLAQGLSNPQIARRLVVSRRTAEHHVQDIYAKIGVSSRAAAALFAMEHDLLP
jgi:HD-GYP domain-containing protein (c-di-GMP phosphodiesterase class II)/DNA-binding CsgD family transcriptional regulator